MLTSQLLVYGIPNANGYIYTPDSIAKVIKPTPCYLKPPTAISRNFSSLDSMAGIAKVTETSNGLIAHIQLLDTTAGEQAKQLVVHIPLTTIHYGTGNISRGTLKLVTNYTLQGITLQPNANIVILGTRTIINKHAAYPEVTIDTDTPGAEIYFLMGEYAADASGAVRFYLTRDGITLIPISYKHDIIGSPEIATPEKAKQIQIAIETYLIGIA